MSLIVVNAGETAVLEAVVAQPMTLRLFTERVTEGRTPDQIDALDASDFTEAAWPGYQPAALNPAGWTIEVGSPTAAVHAPRTFARLTSGDPETVWGYYVTRSDGRLLWFEELPGPIVVEDAGDEVTVEATLTLDDTEGHGMQTGMVMPYAGETLPPGFLWCNGAAVSRTTYARLFAVIGTRFGPGDGSTTFNLPDLRGRFPLGRAQSGTGSVLGETGGSLDHVHGLDSRNSAARLSWAAGGGPLRFSRRTSGVEPWSANVATTQNMSPLAADTTSGITGGIALTGDTESANPPYVTVNYVIKT